MYELCTCAESVVKERNGRAPEHEKEISYSFDEHIEYMLKNIFDENENTSQCDTYALQNIVLANEDTEEDYNDQKRFYVR